MIASDKEIIDLTGDDHEVIVLESDQEDSTVPKTRSRPSSPLQSGEYSLENHGSTSQSSIKRNTSDAEVVSQSKEIKRKSRKKKKRKQVVVLDGDQVEEGELAETEVTAESTQLSREHSRERITSGSRKSLLHERQPKSKSRSKGKGKERAAPEGDVLEVDDESVVEVASQNSELDEPSAPKPPKGARKRERKRKRRDKVRQRNDGNDAQPRSPSPPLFFVDTHAAEVPTNTKPTLPPPPDTSAEPKEEEPPLLLPAHVSVLEGADGAPVEIIQPPPIDSDDDYIDYLDYDDDRRVSPIPLPSSNIVVHHYHQLGVIRYFDDPAETAETKTAKATRIVCKNCGAEGEHKTWECPVIIVSPSQSLYLRLSLYLCSRTVLVSYVWCS